MRRAAPALCVLLFACGDPAPELRLNLRLPEDRRLLRAVTRLDLLAERDGRVVAQRSLPGNTDFVSLTGVSHGPRTSFVLEGLTDAGDVVGHGSTCPIDYLGPGEVSLYFSPVNFFAPTAAAPLEVRDLPIALPLADGSVLIGGGQVSGTASATLERFSPSSADFTVVPGLTLGTARAGAELALLADGAALITGGLGAGGVALADSEVWNPRARQFVPLSNQALGARFGHTATTLPDGRVLIAGGRSSSPGAPLASATLVRILEDATATLQPVMPLVTARADHAAAVIAGIAVVIGGYDDQGVPLSSIEALEPATGGAKPQFRKVGDLLSARAEATATALDDGTLLVVGGRGAAGKPLEDPCAGGLCRDAELYNPILGEATSLPLATARRGHRATSLSGGRVLITGGMGVSGQPLASVELYIPGIGFVSERPLGTPRAGHVAIPLCDGTVLVVGGGAGAEIYAPPVR